MVAIAATAAAWKARVPGTSLALLPFLGAGQTHLAGIYQAEVAKGLRWLLQNQEEDGDLRGSHGQYPGMYAQGQGAIVLCEAFLMTGDEALRVPAQKAIDFIVAAQYPDGGWRYYPRDETQQMQGDTSVVGWQLMALQSALAAGLSVPETTLENAGHFLDTVQHDDGATVLVSAARTGQCPDDRRSAVVPHLPGLEAQSPAVGRLRALDAHPGTTVARRTRTSTTGTTPRRRSIILAAPNGTPGTCRCAMCWSPRRKPHGHAAGSWSPSRPAHLARRPHLHDVPGHLLPGSLLPPPADLPPDRLE